MPVPTQIPEVCKVWAKSSPFVRAGICVHASNLQAKKAKNYLGGKSSASFGTWLYTSGQYKAPGYFGIKLYNEKKKNVSYLELSYS